MDQIFSSDIKRSFILSLGHCTYKGPSQVRNGRVNFDQFHHVYTHYDEND